LNNKPAMHKLPPSIPDICESNPESVVDTPKLNKDMPNNNSLASDESCMTVTEILNKIVLFPQKDVVKRKINRPCIVTSQKWRDLFNAHENLKKEKKKRKTPLKKGINAPALDIMS
jgi:hypothetical protein